MLGFSDRTLFFFKQNTASEWRISDWSSDVCSSDRWPVQAPGIGSERLFGDGRFPTPDGRARFVPTTPLAPAHAPSEQYPFVLNTGRIRDQWHTMTRTGLAPTLAAHRPEPYVDLHPADMLATGVREGGLARVTSSEEQTSEIQ